MASAELALLNWASVAMGVRFFQLRIQSRNFLARGIHTRLGSQVTESFLPRGMQPNGVESLEPCNANQATEKFWLEVTRLQPARIPLRADVGRSKGYLHTSGFRF